MNGFFTYSRQFGSPCDPGGIFRSGAARWPPRKARPRPPAASRLVQPADQNMTNRGGLTGYVGADVPRIRRPSQIVGTREVDWDGISF
jgi:hypothetical protein